MGTDTQSQREILVFWGVDPYHLRYRTSIHHIEIPRP